MDHNIFGEYGKDEPSIEKVDVKIENIKTKDVPLKFSQKHKRAWNSLTKNERKVTYLIAATTALMIPMETYFTIYNLGIHVTGDINNYNLDFTIPWSIPLGIASAGMIYTGGKEIAKKYASAYKM